jgi:hypothetical protein
MGRVRRWGVRAGVLALGLGALAGVGVATGAIPDGSGVIHGCYGRSRRLAPHRHRQGPRVADAMKRRSPGTKRGRRGAPDQTVTPARRVRRVIRAIQRPLSPFEGLR